MNEVSVGQRWRRQDGSIVVVREIRIYRGSREALLVPVEVQPGRRARKSWKWVEAIPIELERCEHGND